MEVDSNRTKTNGVQADVYADAVADTRNIFGL